MISFSGPRRNGKTKGLVDNYRKYGGIFVVNSLARKKFFIKQFNIPEKDILTYYEFDGEMLPLRRKTITNIYFDQIDHYINWKLGENLNNIFITFTGRDCTKELTPLYKAINNEN